MGWSETLYDENGKAIGVQCGRGGRDCVGHCGRQGTIRCKFALRGPKAGQCCNAWVCARCVTELTPERKYCPPHARLAERERAAKAPAVSAVPQARFSGGYRR